MEDFITTTEAAERLGLSSARVRQLVGSGKLPAKKFGPVNMVKIADLELVRDRPPAGRPPKQKAEAQPKATRAIRKRGAKK